MPTVGLGAEKQCSSRGNKKLIYGSFPKPFICSLPCYQNEFKKTTNFNIIKLVGSFKNVHFSTLCGFAQYREHLKLLK